MAAYQPPSSSAGGGGGGGFKLTLKLGSTSAPPANSSVVSAPIPFPTPPVRQTPAPLPPPQAPSPAVVAPTQMLPPPAARELVVKPERVASPRIGRAEEKEARGVSSAKYRSLKRKYLDVADSRDETALALFRAQKLIVRLREDKSSLLDRVLLLESAAGLTSSQVSAALESTYKNDRERDFPLLHPPTLPSLEDRSRTLPALTTSTDLTHSSYNAPLGPPPTPLSYPPRSRSQHIITAVAAQKLRDSNEARRIAKGLPKATFPAVSVLGLEGSDVASIVERALAGERFEPAGSSSGATGTNKRRRESTSPERVPLTTTAAGTGGKGKGKAEWATQVVLPNPFAGAGAVPLGISLAPPPPAPV
ncbi:hypothetical protein P7C70_g5814, partial [Phenoliferia sp. Uapishka_3]